MESESNKKKRKHSICDEICPICHEILTKTNLCVTKCNHTFCLTCYGQHIFHHDTCPLCRENLNVKRPKPLILSCENIQNIVANEVHLYPVAQMIKDILSKLNIDWENVPNMKKCLMRSIVQEYLSGYGVNICLTANGSLIDSTQGYDADPTETAF